MHPAILLADNSPLQASEYPVLRTDLDNYRKAVPIEIFSTVWLHTHRWKPSQQTIYKEQLR